jgi:hypothetical protein
MLSFNCKFLLWFFVVLHMLFFTCYMDVVLLCSSSHALLWLYMGVVVPCGSSHALLLLLYVQYMGVVLCGSSHALLYLYMGCSSCDSSHALLLLYLYLGVDLLCLFTLASLLVHGCGCFVVLHMIFFFTCTWVLWRSILASCWDQTWHWFIPPFNWATKENCTSPQVVSFALTHTIGHINI